MDLGVPELLLILAIAFLVFGAGKLPQIGKGLGEGIRNFRNAVREGENDSDATKPTNPPSA